MYGTDSDYEVFFTFLVEFSELIGVCGYFTARRIR